MYIDSCTHTFDQLVRTVLPGHMVHLRAALAKARPSQEFCADDAGPQTVARRLGIEGDFSGCYVLIERTRPIYVGISRKVLNRLRQHLRGTTHSAASLAYSVAQRRCPTAGHRAVAMKSPAFQKTFANAQRYLRKLNVAFVAIDNPLELHLFEAYAAIELCTHRWNTFRTH